MVDGRLSTQWDQFGWLAWFIANSVPGRRRRVPFSKCNPYGRTRGKLTEKTSADYKRDLADMAGRYVAKLEAL